VGFFVFMEVFRRMTAEQKEELEEARKRFPELDDAARRRAAERMAAGAEAHAALAQEAVLEGLIRAYN
jgi:hypothetical protein